MARQGQVVRREHLEPVGLQVAQALRELPAAAVQMEPAGLQVEPGPQVPRVRQARRAPAAPADT